MVSHELKTPLSSVKGYMQILENNSRKKGDAFATDLLTKANGNVRKMTTLINGFLNVSRLDAGKIHINLQPFDVADLFEKVNENW